MVSLSRALITVLLLAAIALNDVGSCHAQAIDSVFVEVYHVQESSVNGELPLTTYRIYVDLAADHTLQMVYGDDHHQLKIKTTSWFFNDSTNGARYGSKIVSDRLNAAPSALDSWLTIGAASDEHWGVPRALDTDGSVLECPPYAMLKGIGTSGEYTTTTPLCVTDGLIPRAGTEVVDFNFITSYLDKVRGNFLETNNGAWAVLGGVKGVTDRNLVLLAQLTTTGVLSFQLNLQIATPDHTAVKYVAGDPAPGEVLCNGLSYGAYRQAPVAPK